MSRRSPQRALDYLGHIRDAIDRIQTYTQGVAAEDFANKSMIQDAVIRNLEVIGEASRNIQIHHPEFAAEHAHIPFASAYQMRNAVAHGYFAVDLDIVWRTVQQELPGLQAKVAAVLAGAANLGTE